MLSYNRYLRLLRNKTGLSLKEAAKASGVREGLLYLYEQGYRMPSYKNLAKLSRLYERDLIEYFFYEDVSFPHTFDREPVLAKKLRNEKWKSLPKILLIIGLVIMSVGLMIGFVPQDLMASLYGANYRRLHTMIAENGTYTTDLYESEGQKELYQIKQNGDFTSVTADLEDRYYYTEFFSTLRGFEDMNFLSCIFGSNFTENRIWLTGITKDRDYIEARGDMNDDGTVVFDVLLKNGEDAPELEAFFSRAAHQTTANMNDMLKELLGDRFDIQTILSEREMGARVDKFNSRLGLIMLYFGVVMAGFTLSFYLAGKMRKVVLGDIYYVSLKDRPREELRGDIHFGPFITDYTMIFISFAFLIMGTIQLGSSSLSEMSLFRSLSLSADDLTNIGNHAFYIGVFLMTYVQMDIFTSDQQIVRSMCFCFSTFLTIYAIELISYMIFSQTGSAVVTSILKEIPGNIFGVLAMEYLCSLILFYTPEFAKNTRKRTVIWRLCSLIPLIITVLMYFLGNEASRIFVGRNHPFFQFLCPAKYLPFIIASYLCMYSGYALRVYYARKYGVRRAKLFIDGNRYQMVKNGIVIVIVALISSVEYMLRNNEYAIMLGLGSNASIIITIPFLLFYHRHMGKRNHKFERFTRIVYYLMINSYLASALIKLIAVLLFL